MKIKTSKLEGKTLDWAVALAAFPRSHQSGDRLRVRDVIDGEEETIGSVPIGKGSVFTRPFSPSSDWSQGGPLIESRRVMIEPLTRLDHPEGGWCAGFKDRMGVMHGSSALIAAMRAIVAYELGNAVDVPDELAGGD